MLLFRSEDHARSWYGDAGTGAFMTLQQQWQLARIWYEERLSPHWRRRTPDEAQDIFRSIGLAGPFWRLT